MDQEPTLKRMSLTIPFFQLLQLGIAQNNYSTTALKKQTQSMRLAARKKPQSVLLPKENRKHMFQVNMIGFGVYQFYHPPKQKAMSPQNNWNSKSPHEKKTMNSE